MKDFIFLMHDSAESAKAASESDWEGYIHGLVQSGHFVGGSAMGGGVLAAKADPTRGITEELSGFLRVRASSLEAARALLKGNPTYEGGGRVEIRELPKTGSPATEKVSDIHPCLTYDDAAAAIRWLCAVFGFEKRLVVEGPSERVIHSELSLGNGVVMVSSPKPEAKRLGPRSVGGSVATLSVYVEDPDAHYAKALAAGARVVQELRDEEYGARGYSVEDLEGHQWYFGNYRPGAYWEQI